MKLVQKNSVDSSFFKGVKTARRRSMSTAGKRMNSSAEKTLTDIYTEYKHGAGIGTRSPAIYAFSVARVMEHTSMNVNRGSVYISTHNAQTHIFKSSMSYKLL